MQTGSVGGTLAVATLPAVAYSNPQIVAISQLSAHHEEVDSSEHMNQPESTDDLQTEKDKRAIYRHPLFPLMALLFEKCEQASQTPDCPSSDSFDVDIQAFVQHQENDRKPFFVDDPELDGLMVKAIQVLRIHLLELEKVSELCKDFCTRYITCLKGKLQSEQLLRVDSSGLEGDEFGPVPSTPTTPMVQPAAAAAGAFTQVAPGQIVSGNTVYQMVQTPQGLVAQPIQIQTPVAAASMSTPTQPVIAGTTPLSQIGISATPTSSSPSPLTPTSPSVHSPPATDDERRQAKRGVLPKHATQAMKSWLFQHIVHPYPTEDEKKQLSSQTGLSLLQINNWFINARRRILQPMLDASNPDGVKTKKPKPPQTRPSQRFWPENLANLQMQASNAGSSHDSESDTGQADEEFDNSSSPLPADALPTNTPLILSANGTLMTTDGQMVQQTASGQLTIVSHPGVTTVPAMVSTSQMQVTVPSSDTVSSMIENVQQAAALVVQNGDGDPKMVPVASEEMVEETVEESYYAGDNEVKMESK